MLKKLMEKYKLDNAISLVLILVSIYFLFRVIETNTVPFTWMCIIVSIIVILSAIFIVLVFIKQPKWCHYIRRAFIFAFCGLLLYTSSIASSYTISINKLSGDTTVNEFISLISLKDNDDIKDIADLKGKKVAMQTGLDKENSLFVKKKLKNEVKNIEFIEYKNNIDMTKDLLEGKIDAMIMSNKYIDLSIAEDPDFNKNMYIIKEYKRKISTNSSDSKKDITKDTFTILISGMDTYGDVDQIARNDVNMIVVVDPKTRHMEMISLPRDAFVPNMAYNQVPDKLTHTGLEGPDNTVATIENFTGIDIDFYVSLNFQSLTDIVNTIGGIYVDVELDFCYYEEFEATPEENFCYKKGLQYFTGDDALRYSRCRKATGYGDPGRTRAQQRVLTGIMNKLITTEGIQRIDPLLAILPDVVRTNLSASQIQSFIKFQLEDISAWSMNSYTVDSSGANLITASMPSYGPLSCMLLYKDSVQHLRNIYDYMNSDYDLSKFSFDYEGNKLPTVNKLKTPKNMYYFGDDVSAYEGEVNSGYESPSYPDNLPNDNPTTPPTPEVPDVDPTIPEETPTTPQEPQVPEVTG